jgi:hypothetical protein
MVNWTIFFVYSQTKVHFDEIKTSSKVGGKNQDL